MTDLAIFHNQTKQLLNSPKLSDLFYEDLGMQVVKGTLTGQEPSNVEKILAILKEIAFSSKSYLNKLSALSPILGNLILIAEL
jgi:hypothetical protein